MSTLQNCIQSFVDQLIADGLTSVILCPGSRNAPLIQAFVNRNHEIACKSVVDERSAGFIAMGLAQNYQKPVAVVCTSGTAAANLIPASIEAYYSGIPILILTADRPPELIDQWDGQCIRQKGLFSNHIAAEFECPDQYENTSRFQEIAQNAYHKCYEPNGGPVHVNIPLREPLYEQTTQKFTPLPKRDIAPYSSNTKHLDRLKELLTQYNRVMLFNGANFKWGPWPATLPSNDFGLPILSDIISNRLGIQNVRFWDAFLNQKSLHSQDLKPDLLITTGRSTVSKNLKQFLRQNSPVKHVHLSLFDLVGDPFNSNPENLKILENDLWDFLKEHQGYDTAYLEKWQTISEQYVSQVQNIDQTTWNEMQAVQKILGSLPTESVVHLSNSMAVRYASLVNSRTDLVFYGNRGTSGIEGCTSTAVGASMGTSAMVTLITGDISFFYDLNGLWLGQIPPQLRIVVLNNGGGEIFNLIDGPEKTPEVLPFQITNHRRTIKSVTDEFPLNYFCAQDYMELHQSMECFDPEIGPGIIEVRSNPVKNKEYYQRFKNIEI